MVNQVADGINCLHYSVQKLENYTEEAFLAIGRKTIDSHLSDGVPGPHSGGCALG